MTDTGKLSLKITDLYAYNIGVEQVIQSAVVTFGV